MMFDYDPDSMRITYIYGLHNGRQTDCFFLTSLILDKIFGATNVYLECSCKS